jgi:hypothetical protein
MLQLKQWRTRVIGMLLLLWVLCGCIAYLAAEEPNTVVFLKRHYGADDKIIETLAREYDVSVADIPKFGPYPFPVNFIRSQIGWKKESLAQPVVYRRQIEAIVKGYVAKCRIADTIVLYLFYSDRLAPRSIFSRDTSALVMEVGYRLDPTIEGERDDQLLEEIRYFDLGDDGGYDWPKVAPECTPPARL